MTPAKFFILLLVFLTASAPVFAQKPKRRLGGHKAVKSHFSEPGGFDTVHAGSPLSKELAAAEQQAKPHAPQPSTVHSPFFGKHKK